MYNVLEKLCANQPLTPKEKLIHEKALVSVLKQLHDDLDAAVFDAYDWPRTLTDAEILERLVALNAERAREESAGKIRWLRPDYQIPLFTKTLNRNLNPNRSPSTPELALPAPKARKPKASTRSKTAKLPWPKSLPDRTKAVLQEIEKRPGTPFTAKEIASRFTRAQAAQIIEILETLCVIGKTRKQKNGETYTA